MGISIHLTNQENSKSWETGSSIDVRFIWKEIGVAVLKIEDKLDDNPRTFSWSKLFYVT